MGKTGKLIIALAVIAVIAVGAVSVFGNKSADDNPDGSTGSTTNTPATGDTSGDDGQSDGEVAATITYTNSGFGSSSVTVPSGSALRVVNDSDDVIKPSSDPHPVHTDNPQLNFPDVDPGQSATVTLTTKGTWGLHNHYSDDQHTTVVVE